MRPIYNYTYIYIYICTERERERYKTERENELEIERIENASKEAKQEKKDLTVLNDSQ